MQSIDLIVRFRVTLGLILGGFCLFIGAYGCYVMARTADTRDLTCEHYYTDYSERALYPTLALRLTGCKIRITESLPNGVLLLGMLPTGASDEAKLKLIVAVKDGALISRLRNARPDEQFEGMLLSWVGRVMEGIPLGFAPSVSKFGDALSPSHDVLAIGFGLPSGIGVLIVSTVGGLFLALSAWTLRARKRERARHGDCT